jgi:hypothetical protein
VCHSEELTLIESMYWRTKNAEETIRTEIRAVIIKESYLTRSFIIYTIYIIYMD